ncbi:MAG: hypothetical protein DI538_02620 [Azospira oryzae]|jgi:outer membrane protein OmpA-like peptidoglycan-associated protein|nr:MAG: hypothetical protein DI538_02620 [Azospira oryzae]
MKKVLCIIWVAVAPLSLMAQAALRKLSPVINQPSVNVSVPFISLDGNTLLFLSDYAEDEKLVINYSTKEGAVNWKEPITLPKTINNNLNFLKGYTLSPDGKTIYLTNMKTGGIGGFDIYKSELKGATWSELTNLALPINSKLNDGSPTFSADGNTMYFMRCEKMTFDKADACKLFTARRKPNGQWEEPTELPALINTGNSQTPRILGDGETLIFSSNKFPANKGGMDLYMTRWNGSSWSNPLPLDFVNTPNDDQFVTASNVGRYLMKEAPGARRSEIVEVLFPAEIRPKVMMKIEGTVNIPSYISVFNKKEQTRVFNSRPGANGQFTVFLKEGGIYDLSIEPEQDINTFFSKEYNLTNDKFPQIDRITATLKPVAAGDEIELGGVSFRPNSFELDPSSAQDLRRVARMIKANPSFRFAIDVSLFGYVRDSVRSNPDLSEQSTDTVKIPVSYKAIDKTSADSVKILVRDSVVIKNTYHNDRTPHQALEIANYLSSQGVPAKNITLTHHAVPALPENRKVVVKLSVK